MPWCGDADGEISLPLGHLIVHCLLECIIFAVGTVADAATLEDFAEDDAFDVLPAILCLHAHVADFLLHILLVIGEILVELTVTPHIGLSFQSRECFLDLRARGLRDRCL